MFYRVFLESLNNKISSFFNIDLGKKKFGILPFYINFFLSKLPSVFGSRIFKNIQHGVLRMFDRVLKIDEFLPNSQRTLLVSLFTFSCCDNVEQK